MYCYTFFRGSLLPGISVDRDPEENRDKLVLGEKGKGRKRAEVPLFFSNPARVQKRPERRCVLAAHPVKVSIALPSHKTSRRKSIFALAAPEYESVHRCALVRIRTQQFITKNPSHDLWTYGKHAPGTITGVAKGMLLASGKGVHGSNRYQTWRDILIVLPPEIVVRISPEGKKQPEEYILYNDRIKVTCAVPHVVYTHAETYEAVIQKSSVTPNP